MPWSTPSWSCTWPRSTTASRSRSPESATNVRRRRAGRGWILAVLALMLAARADGQPLTGPIELSLPSLTWAVTVPASGFVIESNQSARDGTAQRLMAKNPETNVIVSGALELTRPGATSVQCREFYWTDFSRRLELPRESTRTVERGDIAIVVYRRSEYQWQRLN